MSEETQSPSDETGGFLLPLWAVLILGAVVVGCAIFNIPVFSTLYGIIFPPTPPIPADSTLAQRTVIEHGVEENRYTNPQNPCQVVQFFIAENGTCDVMWDVCNGATFTNLNRSFIPFATCKGVTPAGAFAVRWDVKIDWLLSPDQTAFLMSHEVLWSGMPLPTSTPPIISD